MELTEIGQDIKSLREAVKVVQENKGTILKSFVETQEDLAELEKSNNQGTSLDHYTLLSNSLSWCIDKSEDIQNIKRYIGDIIDKWQVCKGTRLEEADTPEIQKHINSLSSIFQAYAIGEEHCVSIANVNKLDYGTETVYTDSLDSDLDAIVYSLNKIEQIIDNMK